MFIPRNHRWRWALAALAALGIALRVGAVVRTWDQPPHTDMGSFSPTTLLPTHPFDTSPREPLFVWWMWLLAKVGVASTGAIRVATALWFLPNLFLTCALARRVLGERATWGAATLFTVLPGQIVSDTVGLRHLLETTEITGFLYFLIRSPGLEGRKTFAGAATAFAGAVLTRVSYASSGGALLCLSALRSHRWRAIFAGLPAILLLGFHLANNKSRNGDPFYSLNLHSYWFANLEFTGQPGFPANEEERLKNVFRKTLTYRQWAFQAHTPRQYAEGTATGYVRIFRDFYGKTYFRSGLPSAISWVLLGLFGGGLLCGLWRPEVRPLTLALVVLIFPYAFVAHIFSAGRFFSPFTPLVLILTSGAVQKAVTFLRARRGSLPLKKMAGKNVS